MQEISLQVTFTTFKMRRVKQRNGSQEKLSHRTEKQMALFSQWSLKRTFF